MKILFRGETELKHIFIINTYAGAYRTSFNLREELKKFKNLDYRVFQVQKPGGEAELVRKLQRYFDKDELRFYCCGGSGTFRNMLDGIDDLSSTEVAFFPCGLTNDYLKVFGDKQKEFLKIENLIFGRVIKVDYAVVNNKISMNFFSTGMDSMVADETSRLLTFSLFGKKIPYFLSTLYAIFRFKPRKYRVTIDGCTREEKLTEICIGKGNVIGGSMHLFGDANVNNGSLRYLMVLGINRLRAIIGFYHIYRNNQKKLEKLSLRGSCRNIVIESVDGKPIVGNLDGELFKETNRWEISVVEKGLKFVVPREVEIYE